MLRKLSKDKRTLVVLGAALIVGVLLLVYGKNLPAQTNIPLTEVGALQTSKNVPEPETVLDYDLRLERRMEELLSTVDGAGKVMVMITLSNGREIILAKEETVTQSETKDSDRSSLSKSTSEKTVTTVENGRQSPVVLKEILPVVEGIIIVAEGGDNILVKDALTRAAQAVLGLEAHRIQVLTMKK